ncbi:helicase-related protein [Leifsonia sp. 2TAF2]|uniref:helicase-related protein n=1 Tax=Leifsonia sp. 2TAF2 TaxID=3233009 RepID=UPI003F9D215A
MSLSPTGERKQDERLNVAPGSVVVVRDMEWLVTAVESTGDGALIRVQGLSELVRDTTAAFYESIDEITPLDPSQARIVGDSSAGYRRAKLWLEATLRKTAVPLGADELTVSTQMLSDPLDYQQAAVRQVLSSATLRPRILIADAVGLGKTIEIGMILSELVRRGRGERILIVTPRHVLEQMQYEMWTRFALPFVRLDSVGIQRVRQTLPATRNPFSLYKRAIISIDTLKQEKYRAHLAKQRWDAVVIDESHNITGATLNNRLAKTLAPNTEALILASATPHNGKKESFAELIRLLEPTAVTPDGDIIEDEVRRLIIRRHRHSPEVAREVGADWAERMPPRNLLVAASPAENAVADELSSVWLHPESGSSPYSGSNKGLFPWTLAKAFLSSPAALVESISERVRRLGTALSIEQRRERDALEHLLVLARTSLDQPSAKYVRLLEYLRSISVGSPSDVRAVVFSERVATLDWLRKNLGRDLKLKDDQIRILHGGLTDVEQQEIVESFKQQSSPIRVLVTGDVASEGVNLHSQCHELIHFDIPWSLIRIEQRNGRIDRYGQRQRPQITTLLLSPDNADFSGDVRVLQRLLEREEEAHTALGDAASLMGKYDVGAEEEAIKQALANQANIDQVVPAVEHALTAGDSVGALLARLAGTAPDLAPAPLTSGQGAENGLFASELDYLREALTEVYTTPGASATPDGGGGVSWREHGAHGTVELAPRKDLKQRLSVLPQSYLAERHVTERLMLATTRQRAKTVLQDAIDDPEGRTLWPEAHYLGPLHPVLEWASDRALGRLGRNEVFAIRGDVSSPTVVLVGTLTNRRGQTVAASYLTVEVPMLDTPEFALVSAHPSAGAAIAAAGLTGQLVNSGPVDITDELQAIIAPAVSQAISQMRTLAAAAGEDVHRRVAEWSDRVDQWQQAATGLTQIAELRSRRTTVEQERQIAESMLPEQTLVRPLLVVVPAGDVEEK